MSPTCILCACQKHFVRQRTALVRKGEIPYSAGVDDGLIAGFTAVVLSAQQHPNTPAHEVLCERHRKDVSASIDALTTALTPITDP
jgi:hypothetical protein